MNVKNFYLKRLMSDKNTKNAFTLAEVIIVMLVVAVVAGICIKITKVKLNNILSVNYYSSYNTLKTISTELFRDFKQKMSGFTDGECTLSDDEKSFSCCSGECNAEPEEGSETKQKTVTSLYNGQNFCEKFVENANTASSLVSEECNGDNIGVSLTDFSNKDPDFVLRNGMKFYNFSKDPTGIAVLKGNSRGKKHTTKDGTEIDLDEWGYTVYVDVDGEKGKDSKLWKDVYRFYITLSGTVIPAYDSANPGDFGGDSTFHLQTSVSDQYAGASGRVFRWVTKSKSFKESACTMGLVKTDAGDTYCSGVAPDNDCATNDSHDCKLKTIVPIKFFN